MAVYKVPQDVEAEDKLVGPFTFRQFIFLIVAAISLFLTIQLFSVNPLLTLVTLPALIVFGTLGVYRRPDQPAPSKGRVHLPEAGLLVDRRNGATLYVALNKGGVFKCFAGERLSASDTQISLQVQNGNRTRCALAHLVS